MKHEKSCGAVVFTKKNDVTKFLIIRHLNGSHWGIPKGHVEGDETEAETALREIKEEVGLDIKIIPGFRQVIQYSPARHIMKQVVFFIGEALDDNVTRQEDEIQDYKWTNYEEAISLLTHDNNKAVLIKAYGHLQVQGRP